jgi:arylsulfatase A-like enzyme/Tfp pilus assembly protein PilF
MASQKIRVTWLAVLLAGLTSLAPQIRMQTKPRPNLLLVSIDTLRADRLGCYGYDKIRTPHIDQLAAEGVRFETVVSQVPLTLPSHCSILTGTYPAYHGVRDNVGYRLPESRTTLAEILASQGYQTAAFIGAYVLHSRFGLAQGFTHYDDQFARPSRSGSVVNLNSVERSAGEVTSHAMNWLNSKSDSPFFAWIHLFDPHDPYEPPPAFLERYKGRPYDGEIAYVDQEIGRLLAFLKQKGLYQNTLVVLVGDHGESFGEHQEWTHGFFIYDTTLLVPLIVKPVEKGFAGRSVREQITLVDVVPTLLQLLDVQAPAELQGRGMLGLMLGQARDWPELAYCESYYPAQFGWSPLVGLRRKDTKFIRAPKPELFNLRQDPGELTNRISLQSAVAAEMKAALSKIESIYGGRSAGSTARVELSSQQLDELRALGYVGMSTPSRPLEIPGPGAADPKDKLRVYELISAGSQNVANGRYREALPQLERVIRMEPGMRMAWSMLGRCYFELNRFESARKAFQKILENQPEDLNSRFYLAACGYRQKDWIASEAGFKQVLEKDGNYAPAHLYLGFIYQARGDKDSALTSFQRVIELDPENEDAHAKAGFLLASRGKLIEAVPHFQKVIQLNPSDAEAHANLGLAYLKLDQPENARAEFALACRLDRKYCRDKK